MVACTKVFAVNVKISGWVLHVFRRKRQNFLKNRRKGRREREET